MAFERPTFGQLRDRILADIDAEMSAGDPSESGAPYSRGLTEYAIACAVAAVALLLYAYLERVARNTVPDRAESDAMLQWAAFFGIDTRPATSNKGPARWAAVGGSMLPAAHPVRLADGTEYTVDATVVESGGFVTAALTAAVAGVAGRATADTGIVLGTPVAGVAPNGIVLAPGLTDGTDTERPRSVLARLLARLRQPPRGGGPGDYVQWALQVPGVTRAWEYTPYTTPSVGAGAVRLLFTTDDEASPIPTGPKVAEVQAYIDARRPVTVRNFVAAAPIELPTSFAITLEIEDDAVLANVQAAALANIRAVIKAEAVPGRRMPLSRISEAVSKAAGEYEHEITSPAGTEIVPDIDELITLATPIVWS